MAVRREKLQLFSMSFLDVISCGFGAVLLVFLLVASQSQRNAKVAMEERTVAFTMQLRAQRTGQSVNYIPNGRVFVVFPPRQDLEIGESYPPEWERSVSSDLSTLCLDNNVTPRGQILYGVFRGVKLDRFLIRVVLHSPLPANVDLFVRGWVTDPTRGYRDLRDAILPSSKGIIATTEELQVSEGFVIELDGIVN